MIISSFAPTGGKGALMGEGFGGMKKEELERLGIIQEVLNKQMKQKEEAEDYL